MKLPKEIQGDNKIRDFDICKLYIDGLSPEQIKDKRKSNLTIRRIQQILSKNANFVNERVGWDKTKRLHRLQQIAEKLPDKLSQKKDILNVLEQIRKEMEGDKPQVEQHIHFTNFRSFIEDAYGRKNNNSPKSRESQEDTNRLA
jgi:hypothetical protein